LPTPRTLFYDIETAPSLGWYFDLYKEGNIVSTARPWFMLSFAYKVQGEKKIHYHCLADYPGYSKNKTDDKALVTDLHRLVFCNADVLVGHNIDRFDSRKSKARFLAHGLPPPPPVKTIDTLKIARRVFKMDSNRLAAVGEYLGLGGKATTTGWKLWQSCIEGDLTAYKQMGIYNRRDVDLLEQVFNRLAPWQPNAPYLGSPGCPSCHSDRIQRRGVNVNKAGKVPRFQCSDCGHWFSGKCYEKEAAA
jgi:DNA polymerase elongation subunit (family B)